jgi:hypothetical protein
MPFRLPKVAGTAGRRARPALELLEDRTVPTLVGNSLFPADNPWNQQITNAPTASNSNAIINNIITKYSNGQFHPDFGQDYGNGNDLYGIPYNVVHGNSVAKVHVVIDNYPDQSDLQNAPIPANAVIEGDFQNGPRVGLNNRGDSHLLVYDEDTNIAYEFYLASRPSENGDGQWHAGQETVWNMNTDQFRTLGWTSADAAGLPILPGLVRPDEALPTSQGGQGVIKHALRFTLQNSIILDQYLYPASHIANSGNNPAVQPPMGARFRLKAGVDISQLNPQAKIIAQALKDYGMIVADNGSNFYISGASYAVDASNNFSLTWNDNDVQDSAHGLKSLRFSDFEVVDLSPAVTGLSTSSGANGTTVTVLGRNFSGAAGNLQVLFGNTPSPSVTVVDDGHVTAVVPNGSATVDVRVQSGASAPGNSANINNPIFGYGISPITTADRFTIVTTPVVLSILRANGAAALTNASSVAFTVTFNENVVNVGPGSFVVTTSGVSGAGVSTVTGSGSVYTVTVNTGSGNGALRLDVSASNNIVDSGGNPLPSGGYTGGQSYTLDHTPPALQSIALSGSSPTNAASVAYVVTFSKAVTGVNAADFTLTAAGVSGASITNVTGSGSVWTVTASTGSGNGTLRLDLKTSTTIQDLAGNALPGGGFTGGPSYVIDKTPPTVVITAVTPSPRTTAVGSMTITFSKPVVGFSLANLQLKTSGGGNLLTGAQTLTSSDNITWTLGNLAGLTDPTHRAAAFTLTLSPAGVADAAGNALAAGASSSFTVVDPTLALQGTTLTFTGTSGNDSYSFTAGAVEHVVLNGVSFSIDPAAAATVNFVGNGGSDTATLTAAGAGNSATLLLGYGQLQGPGYSASASGVTTLTVSDGGADSATLGDSTGLATFVGMPGDSYLQGNGDMSSAVGFKTVTAYAGAGTNESAYFGDTVGNALFVGRAAYSYLQGGGLTEAAVGFKTLTAYGKAGGSDPAYLVDTTGNAMFVGRPTGSYLQGGGVTNAAVGFASVTAYALAGSNDVAVLYDGAGANTFWATAGSSALYGAGYLNDAVGFKTVYAVATGAASSDTAVLHDAPGNNVFYGQGSSAVMTNNGAVMYNVSGFGQVAIVSSLGGFDQAFLSSLFYVLTESGPWH